MAEVMTIPADRPELVDTVAEWIGREPDSVKQLYGQVRWCWRWTGRESFERDFQPNWTQWEESRKSLLDYMKQRLCLSVCWPSEDVFDIAVILRDHTLDVWCMPEEERWAVPWFRDYFCRGCNRSKDTCRCPH